jgi:hypothetical protein
MLEFSGIGVTPASTSAWQLAQSSAHFFASTLDRASERE